MWWLRRVTMTGINGHQPIGGDMFGNTAQQIDVTTLVYT